MDANSTSMKAFSHLLPNDLSYQVQAYDTREVIILGSSGAGKSNLCNMLCRAYYFRSGNTINSVSKAVQKVVLYITKNLKYYSVSVYDTPGYFDSTRDDAKTQSEVNVLLKFGVPYLSCLFILVEHIRAADIAYQTLKYYLGLIDPKSAKGVVTIIITKCKVSGRNELVHSYMMRSDYNTLLSDYGLDWTDVKFVDLDLDFLEIPTKKRDIVSEVESIMNLIFDSYEIHSTFKLFPVLHATELAVNTELLAIPEQVRLVTEQLLQKLTKEERERIKQEAITRAKQQQPLMVSGGCFSIHNTVLTQSGTKTIGQLDFNDKIDTPRGLCKIKYLEHYQDPQACVWVGNCNMTLDHLVYSKGDLICAREIGSKHNLTLVRCVVVQGDSFYCSGQLVSSHTHFSWIAYYATPIIDRLPTSVISLLAHYVVPYIESFFG